MYESINTKEFWKEVKGYEGLYEVSNLGNVRSLSHITNHKHIVKGKILTGWIVRGGYRCVWLYNNGKRSHALVHRLVAEAFIPNINNKPEVNHIDGNKLNNNPNNLEWVTRSENEQHARKSGLKISDPAIMSKISKKYWEKVKSNPELYKTVRCRDEKGRFTKCQKI